MYDDFVADLPPFDLGADGPDHAGSIRAGDMDGLLMGVERRNRLAESGPDAVVIDARRHHQDENVMAVELPGRHDFELHGRFRRTVAVLADHPGVHVLWHMAERRNFADIVKILQERFAFGLRAARRWRLTIQR